MNKLGMTALVSVGTVAVILVALWPRQTSAQEVSEYDRQGEWDDDGMKFGDIVVRGALVADGTVPGGWVLVRHLENKSDAPSKCTVEERVTRTETMPDARVEPMGVTVVLRTQTFELGPHQKRAIGVPLAEPLGKEITANAIAASRIQNARARAFETGKYNALSDSEIYMRFGVDYLKPLKPGQTAAPIEDNGVTHPARMPGP